MSLLTMSDAIDMAREEIWRFHKWDDGFPPALTNNTAESLKRTAHHTEGFGYEDYGNWCGSVLIYALLFGYPEDDSVLGIFDPTGERAAVYANWGLEHQRSGVGPDNTRTNLLESILNRMGPQKGRCTQRAWEMVYVYALRHPSLSRQQLLAQALEDPSTDILSDEFLLIKSIAQGLGNSVSPEHLKADLVFDFVREQQRLPIYAEICQITGCSKKNKSLRDFYWHAADIFLKQSGHHATSACAMHVFGVQPNFAKVD